MGAGSRQDSHQFEEPGAKLAAFIHEAVEAFKKIERVKGMIEKEIYPTLSNKYPHFSINDIV